jgi:TolB-like protein/Tfp pilus assembly protein PilF
MPPDVGLSNAPRLSIVVLPFANLGDDPKDDYLAAGITDDVTTDLSRVPGMFVIARESAYTYQGKTVDVRRIGEELGVRYVLEGSVRRFGDALRINAQLIGTESNAHFWADRFDQNLIDLSAGQDEIVSRISQTLNVALTDIESARSKRERPTNPDAFDLILRARALSLRPVGPGEHAQRIALLEQAARLDPNSIEAMTQLALELTIMERMYGHAGDLDRAAGLIARAAAINPDDRWVLHTTAYILFAQYRDSEALAAWQNLLAKHPNAASAYGLMGDCLVHMGRPAEAIPVLEMALRRDPRNPYIFDRFDAMGTALQLLGKDKEAIPWIERALASVRSSDNYHRAMFGMQLAAEHAQLGQLEVARAALAEANRLWPYYTVRGDVLSNTSIPIWVALYRRDQVLFRLIGLRDHADEDADFGVPADNDLHSTIAGLTPTSVPGATTIRTGDLAQLIRDNKVLVIDTSRSWAQSLVGAVALTNAGHGGSTSDVFQDRLRKKMQELTKADLKTPIVAVGWNSERFDGRNLAIRLVALGYTNVYWYRGGREAWEVAGLPESDVTPQEW